MFKHEIFSLFRTFSKEELRKFDLFLKSPYFNNSRKLAVLYEEIIRFHPLYSHHRLTKEKLYKKINRKEKYNDSTIRSMLSRLMSLGQRFIKYEAFEKNDMEQDNILLKEVSDRNLVELFNKNLKILDEKFNNIKKIDTKYFFNKIQYETIKLNNNLQNVKILNQKDVNKDIDDLFNRGLHLTFYYICELIGEYSILNSFKKNFNIEKKALLLESLINDIDINGIIKIIGKDNKYSFILELYKGLFKTLSDYENDIHYFKYKRLVENSTLKLSPDEITFHYTKLINYCIIKSLSKPKFKLELFEIYNCILTKEYYKNSKAKYLPLAMFRNILIYSIGLNKYDWTKNFINVYTYKLHRDEIDNMFNFGYAYYYNAIGEYSKALEYLNELKQDYFRFKTDYKNLSLLLYYELDFTEETLYLVHSYRKFLKRNEMVTNDRKKILRNFLYYIEKLVLYKSGDEKIDIHFLKDKIQKVEGIYKKQWLLDKMNELMKKE